MFSETEGSRNMSHLGSASSPQGEDDSIAKKPVIGSQVVGPPLKTLTQNLFQPSPLKAADWGDGCRRVFALHVERSCLIYSNSSYFRGLLYASSAAVP